MSVATEKPPPLPHVTKSKLNPTQGNIIDKKLTTISEYGSK